MASSSSCEDLHWNIECGTLILRCRWRGAWPLRDPVGARRMLLLHLVQIDHREHRGIPVHCIVRKRALHRGHHRDLAADDLHHHVDQLIDVSLLHGELIAQCVPIARKRGELFLERG
jgi:hypothetical protein